MARKETILCYRAQLKSINPQSDWCKKNKTKPWSLPGKLSPIQWHFRLDFFYPLSSFSSSGWQHCCWAPDFGLGLLRCCASLVPQKEKVVLWTKIELPPGQRDLLALLIPRALQYTHSGLSCHYSSAPSVGLRGFSAVLCSCDCIVDGLIGSSCGLWENHAPI